MLSPMDTNTWAQRSPVWASLHLMWSSDPKPNSSVFYGSATVRVLKHSKDTSNFKERAQRPQLSMERVSKNLWTYFCAKLLW